MNDSPETKKKKSPRAAVGKTSARTLDLKSKAFELLLQGLKCPAIGEALGVSRVHAWKLAKEGLAELRAETLEDAAEWRTFLTQSHLEQLEKGRALRDGSDKVDADAKGFAVVDTALSQLKALWVPALPTSVKTELTGANGGPLQTQALGAPDLTRLTDEQLAQLENILSSVIPAEPAAVQVQ